MNKQCRGCGAKTNKLIEWSCTHFLCYRCIVRSVEIAFEMNHLPRCRFCQDPINMKLFRNKNSDKLPLNINYKMIPKNKKNYLDYFNCIRCSGNGYKIIDCNKCKGNGFIDDFKQCQKCNPILDSCPHCIDQETDFNNLISACEFCAGSQQYQHIPISLRKGGKRKKECCDCWTQGSIQIIEIKRMFFSKHKCSGCDCELFGGNQEMKWPNCAHQVCKECADKSLKSLTLNQIPMCPANYCYQEMMSNCKYLDAGEQQALIDIKLECSACKGTGLSAGRNNRRKRNDCNKCDGTGKMCTDDLVCYQCEYEAQDCEKMVKHVKNVHINKNKKSKRCVKK